MCKKCFILFGGGKSSEVIGYDFLIFFTNTIDYIHGGIYTISLKKNRMVFCKIILY